MSFILDALRKSETERQQQAAPSLADAHYRRGKTDRNVWIPILVLVLTANAVILAIVMRDDGPERDGEVANTAAPMVGSKLVADPAVRPLAREIPSQAATPATVSTDDKSAEARQEPAGNQFDTRISTNAEQISPGNIQEGLPSLQQLVASGQLPMLALHLDIHVYADSGSERFVFINMKKYREGDMLTEGPTVEEITRTGVILDYRGERFTLDRD
jgi:general secretion pathway protein B